ncbi:MAG: hypothetical protein ACKOUM_09615 [Sphingopyxis sp.]
MPGAGVMIATIDRDYCATAGRKDGGYRLMMRQKRHWWLIHRPGFDRGHPNDAKGFVAKPVLLPTHGRIGEWPRAIH